ncbi:hypothetical protein ASG89_26150 [Paenibacillus sp. Soil766]|uniref:DNA phosphorothioation-dependent restriction protein DptG n=1 Tax=Paenibacillus sp. Soil766 TaxID=1736404 RepID=UPI000709704F|nr:DNA phosphorothioation-dependent restriction protein DptG [Paenibacillus sp. Soil766]KRF01093.1 hypothetical protein ASG89_26150 [Paenibacillus sp. Soil766]
MTLSLDVIKLRSLLSKKKHETGKVADILPFVATNGKDLNNDFGDLIGEYVRQICGHVVKKKPASKDQLEFEDPLISQLTGQIEFKNESQIDLERFLRQYLYSQNNNMKVFHPYIYNFIPVPEKDTYRKYAIFLSEILVQDEIEMKNIFTNKNADDILTELVLKNLELKAINNSDSRKYQLLLPFLSSLYKEDIMFISKYQDYFLSNFTLLTHFYSFMYICQLLLKFERFEKGEYSEASTIYFALEWEAVSKRRKASEAEGFQGLKKKLPHLFVHVHTMSQLSHIQSETAKENPSFLTYRDIHDQIKEDQEMNYNYLNDLKIWIQDYSKLFLSDDEIISESPTNIESAMGILFDSIKKGTNTEVAERYGKKLEGFGGKTFIKNRGSLGQVLNINQEMLLLLTTVCVKNERMPVNKLFEEFSKRGVNFDRLSKKAIIELFDSLNILDKKSDSGDAQYVKPIL